MSHQPANRVCNCNQAGWMPGIYHVPIRWTQPPWIRQRAGQMRPVAIVDHIMQGYLSTMEAWASNGESPVIVQFGINRAGRTVQFQPVDTPGRHVSAINSPASSIVRTRGQDAGTTGANNYTIGIEHEGCAIDPRPAYTVPATLIYGPDNPWPEAMVQASIRVKQWCFDNIPSLGQPSRDSIIGHYEVDMRNRPDDPVSREHRNAGHQVWPVDRMIAALAGAGGGGGQGDDVDRDYTMIKPGESLWGVSQREGISVPELADLNGIEDSNVWKTWQVLRKHDGVPPPPLLTDRPPPGGDGDLWDEGYRLGARHGADRLQMVEGQAKAHREQLLAQDPPARPN